MKIYHIIKALTFSGDRVGVALLDDVHGQLKVGIGHVNPLEPVEATIIQIIIEIFPLVLVFFPVPNKGILGGQSHRQESKEKDKGFHDGVGLTLDTQLNDFWGLVNCLLASLERYLTPEKD